MKRFRFQLEPVLNFKQQSLDALMTELSVIQAQVAAQENIRAAAYQRLAAFDEEYENQKIVGMTILEAMERQSCQKVLENRAKHEDDELSRLRRAAEKKRDQVVAARMETHSLEKLKENRRSEYDKDLAKSEEKALDDLTAFRRIAG